MKEIRDKLQQLIYKVINPIVRLLIKIGLTPNMVTLIGLILNITVTAVLIFGAEKSNRGDLSYIGWAGALILFAGLFDMLDGQVARLGNKSSTFGALFDSVLDRYSEMILFFGICYYLVAHHYFLSSVFAFLALIGSMMVSYIRARAEGLGVECKGGLMQRPERIVLISISAIACGVTAHYIGSDYKIYFPDTDFQLFETMSIFTFPITLMAVLTNITAIGRLRDAKKALEKKESTNKPSKVIKLPLLSLLLIITILGGSNNSVKAQTIGNTKEADTFPIPPKNNKMMFYLQRTPNTNTIVYALNYDKNSNLHESNPIKVYWIRYTEKGHPTRDLNYIQKIFAYGIKAKKSGKDTWDLKMVAYNKLPLVLKKGNQGLYKVYVTINKVDYVFTKAYIKVDGGSFWSPNIPYIDIYAKDEALGKEIIHRINNPKK
tara:strand:- start:17444 stop:18742 length:1299 start_codon:yes stop_codon:yes gene_type:complete